MGFIHRRKNAALLLAVVVVAGLAASLSARTRADEAEQPKLTYRFEGKTLTALDETGKEKWTRKFDGDIGKVVLEGDYLFVVTGKSVLLLTPLSGIERWKSRAEGVTKVEVREPRALISGSRLIAAVDIVTGKEDWRYKAAEDIESYVIHDDRFMVVKTPQRVVALDYGDGKRVINTMIGKGQKYLKSQALGPMLLLHLEDKIRLWNPARRKELPEIKTSAIKDRRDEDLAKALKEMLDKVTSRKEQDRVVGMAELVFMKNKEGKLLLLAGLKSEDEDVVSAAQNVMRSMAEYSRSSSEFLAATTHGVLEELSAADSSGTIEKAFYTAYYEKYSYEMPDPETTLKVLVTMLSFADKDGRAHAIQTLELLTGKTLDYKHTDSLRQRSKAVKKWDKWLSAYQGRFVWDIPARKIKVRE